MKNLSEVKMTTEILEKVQECETADELMELAKENGAELTREEAEECFSELKHHLTDEELDSIAGGGGWGPSDPSKCSRWGHCPCKK